MHNLEALTAREKDELLVFFLHFMGQEQRGHLMSEKPLTYTKLYPTAKQAVIERVGAAVAAVPPC